MLVHVYLMHILIDNLEGLTSSKTSVTCTINTSFIWFPSENKAPRVRQSTPYAHKWAWILLIGLKLWSADDPKPNMLVVVLVASPGKSSAWDTGPFPTAAMAGYLILTNLQYNWQHIMLSQSLSQATRVTRTSRQTYVSFPYYTIFSKHRKPPLHKWKPWGPSSARDDSTHQILSSYSFEQDGNDSIEFQTWDASWLKSCSKMRFMPCTPSNTHNKESRTACKSD